MHRIQTIYGVDFSGGVRAAEKIWITQIQFKNRRPEIITCQNLREYLGIFPVRTEAYLALTNMIATSKHALWAMDFPFGLPEKIIRSKSWERFVASFSKNHPNPYVFRAWCRTQTFGNELKRVTDIETRTPFSPYNLRIYRQTYYGLASVLSALVQKKQIVVLPMMYETRTKKPLVIEICPASTLKKHKLYFPYKGKTPGLEDNRRTLLEALQNQYNFLISNKLKQKVILEREGDALDSVVAALAAFDHKDSLLVAVNASYQREGYVYV